MMLAVNALSGGAVNVDRVVFADTFDTDMSAWTLISTDYFFLGSNHRWRGAMSATSGYAYASDYGVSVADWQGPRMKRTFPDVGDFRLTFSPYINEQLSPLISITVRLSDGSSNWMVFSISDSHAGSGYSDPYLYFQSSTSAIITLTTRTTAMDLENREWVVERIGAITTITIGGTQYRSAADITTLFNDCTIFIEGYQVGTYGSYSGANGHIDQIVLERL